MNKQELQDRTKQFAIRVVYLCRKLNRSEEGRIIARQLLRAGTSVAANYRAACRARSRAEFLAKLGIVEEEADEACFWLEMIIETSMMKKELLVELLKEANELVAIFVSAKITTRG